MSSLKKFIVAPLAVFALSASVHSMAAPINHTIMLQATVPTKDFYVLPSDSTWIGNVQQLQYNAVTGDLSSLVKTFDVKNTAGNVTAQVTSSASLAGPAVIPLTVKFNGIALGATPVEVVKADVAKAATTAKLEIIPVKPAAGYVAGTYDGNINLTFDAGIKP
ncbi:fimbrial protein [Pseudomonas mosselii]|uniref:CS1 type fimbrial major subunit n=1 Tax=Pseudomonas mosselii TaxID=78327 RepID=UPI002DBD67B6|nr:CS1 type fimbrial major subunit [Pseudomonas mosselii]MEB5932393.1 fimbrial protein [Pseudomonas mosselii]